MRALIIERHWQKFDTFESQFRRAAKELAAQDKEFSGQDNEPDIAKVTVSSRQFERWYAGRIKSEPYPDTCRILEHLFGYPIRELLSPASRVTESSGNRSALTPHHELQGAEARDPGTVDSGLITDAEWPVWFGMRVAHLVTLVDNWRGMPSQFDALQGILHEEILMFDADAPGTQESARISYRFSRRQALVTLAALPLTLTTSGVDSMGRVSVDAAADYFLSRSAASLTACWHLLRGSDLAFVDQMLSNYLLGLQGLAQRPSKYQQAAARLASQAHRICGIAALHRNQIHARERHCKQAVRYSELAADDTGKASALISLASTYFYDDDPARAASVYEEACQLEDRMSDLQRSRVYAELAVVYGQLGREQDAVRSAGRAGELYPRSPEQDPSYLYAEFTPASLILEQGLAYSALAEHNRDRGYQQNAVSIFSRMETTSAPERIRYEIINHQARMAILLNDLEAFEKYFLRGLDGIILLGSGQRRKEMNVALRLANEKWSGQRRLNNLKERLQLTAGNNAKESG